MTVTSPPFLPLPSLPLNSAPMSMLASSHLSHPPITPPTMDLPSIYPTLTFLACPYMHHPHSLLSLFFSLYRNSLLACNPRTQNNLKAGGVPSLKPQIPHQTPQEFIPLTRGADKGTVKQHRKRQVCEKQGINRSQVKQKTAGLNGWHPLQCNEEPSV